MNSIMLWTWAWDYETPPPKNPSNNDAIESYSNTTNGPLHIELLYFDTVIHPPKGVTLKSFHNPSVYASQHHNIIEDLSQASCAMVTLEVL